MLFGDEQELYETSDELREIFFGDYENRKASEVSPHYFEGFALNEKTANGETLTEFTYRIISKVEQVMGQAKKDGLDSVTIVCHSGVIKAILLFLGNMPFSEFGNIQTKNGLGYVLDVDYNETLNSLKLNEYEAIKEK